MSVVNAAAPAPSLTREHLNIIHSAEAKRYKLNVRTPIGRLTIGRVKQCLASASSCPIPLDDMVLHLNGVPLSSDDDLCASFGISSGATLSVEDRHWSNACNYVEDSDGGVVWQRQSSPSKTKHVTQSLAGAAATSGTSSPSHELTFPMSDRRRLLELQTLQQQDEMLRQGGAVQEDVLRRTLHRADNEMEHATRRRGELERQRERAEKELRCMKEKEAEVARERERLSLLHAQEAARATERAAQLAERREQLRAEQEAARAVALLKLENEKKKSLLAQQQELFEAEKKRVQLEQESFEATTKARELQLRAREIDLEHQRLARIREARALDMDRRLAVQQRLRYYAQLGVEAPPSLQHEAKALFLCEEEDHDGDSGHQLLGSQGYHPDATPSATRLKAPAKSLAENVRATNVSDLVHKHRSPSSSPLHARNGAEAVVAAPDGSLYNARENADANLCRLSSDLGLHERLEFDDANTCIIGIDGEYTLLITYDAASERLYLYSTLLASLPPVVQDTVEGRLKMYEFLLEASLLGREMCGGGVGASIRNNFVLMSASLYMPTSQPWSLCTLVPQFLDCLRHWRMKLAEFLQTLEAEEGYAQCAGSSSAAPAPPEVSPQTPMQHLRSPTAHSTSPPMAHSAHHHGSPPIRVLATHPRSSATSPSRSQDSQSMAPYVESSKSSLTRATPVLGLEVTGTVLVNGVPTRYTDGVLVVNTAGPAALAGVQPNDFIEELNCVRIRNVSDFRRVIEEQLTPGMLVPVRINRGGLSMVVTIRAEEARSP